jgi:hypothetical protein
MKVSESMKLEKYVGRVVRLKESAFQEIARRAKRHGKALENCFLVAGISAEMRKLICYGADLRIMVGASEVVLI